MKIIYETGDLVRSTERAIAHGCNAQGAMGSGIAKQVRADYPHAYEVYRKTYDTKGLKVGHIIPVPCKHEEFGDKLIFNAITQEFFGGKPGVIYVDYDGVAECVDWMNEYASITQSDSAFAKAVGGKIDRIGFPLIGAGLAGGDWSKIAAIIEDRSKLFQPVVYLFDGKMPA